jgi:DNA-binding transcriptional ArsR family regulator
MPSFKTKVAQSAEKSPKSAPKAQLAKGIGKVARLSKGISEVSAVFKNVGDPVRLHILLTLAEAERGVTELCTIFGLSQPAISHHLAVLRHGGLISPRRQGKQNLYSLTKQGQLIANLFREIQPIKQPRKRPSPTIVPIDPGLLDDLRGFVDDPEGWFRTPNAEFEGRKPVDLLGTADEPRLRNRIAAAKLGMFS